jgi:hypothetical protein
VPIELAHSLTAAAMPAAIGWSPAPGLQVWVFPPLSPSAMARLPAVQALTLQGLVQLLEGSLRRAWEIPALGSQDLFFPAPAVSALRQSELAPATWRNRQRVYQQG